MREEFEKMAAAGKLERHHIEALVQLTTTGFCMHRSWGFGRIKTVDTVFARFMIDFDNKAGHTMDLAFAAESLKPIAKDHILARKASDLETLRQMAATQHQELVKLVLNSYGGKATVEQIQQALVPDVIRDDWKKWWDAARRELKKDGHFQVPLKKSEPIIYQVKEVSLQDRLMEEFRAAKGLKARILVASELLKNAHDLTDKAAAATEVIATFNTEIPSYQRTQPAVALEAIFARDDMRVATGAPPSEGELTAQSIWAQECEAGPAAGRASGIQAPPGAGVIQGRESRALAQRAAGGTLNSVSAKLCHELAGLLIQEGKIGQLKETVARLVSQHTASSELLLWLAKDRNDSFADILGPEVFRAMLTAMERDQFNERRSNRLRDFILDDQSTARRAHRLRRLRGHQGPDARFAAFALVRRHGQALAPGAHREELPGHPDADFGRANQAGGPLLVSWESLERRKNEYRELVEKKIPANSKEIAVARSYGDLSENHEYKAAKEMQKLLMRRKADLETQLVRARGTDFAVRTDVASIGTIVQATDLATNQPERFTILGAWDSDPEKEGSRCGC
jgi:transcription elongation GreA/GreB family factor